MISNGRQCRFTSALVLVTLTLLYLLPGASCLNNFMVIVKPGQWDCYFTTLLKNEDINLSVIVEHDDAYLPYYDKIDLSFYDPKYEPIKSFKQIEHTEFSHKSVEDGTYYYCFHNPDSKQPAAVSFTVWSPEEERMYNIVAEEVLKTPEGKDYKQNLVTDLMKLNDSVYYLSLKISFIKRRTKEQISGINSATKAIMYWTTIQAVTSVVFSIFQISYTKRFINARHLI